MEMEKPGRSIRVLMTKVGLDGHDRGAKTVATGLREEGMEVIYTGLRQNPEAVVEAAVKDDVDVIGVSSLTGGHNIYFPQIVELLAQKGVKDILLICGGIIPQEDVPFLNEKGVKAVFTPGTTIKEIADFIRANVKR
jgi:methylmalonyl-CoA mutase C-terminal domain/subunit